MKDGSCSNITPWLRLRQYRRVGFKGLLRDYFVTMVAFRVLFAAGHYLCETPCWLAVCLPANPGCCCWEGGCWTAFLAFETNPLTQQSSGPGRYVLLP